MEIDDILPNWTPAQASGTSRLRVPTESIYSAIPTKITHGVANDPMTLNDMRTHVKSIRLLIGGVDVWSSISGADFIDIHRAFKLPEQDGVLPILFRQNYFDKEAEEMSFLMGTQDFSTCVLEVEWSDTVVNPQISSEAVMEEMGSAIPNAPLGTFIVHHDYNGYNAGGAGWFEIRDMDVFGSGETLKSILINTAAISEWEFKHAKYRVRGGTIAATQYRVALRTMETGGRVYPAGKIFIDIMGNQMREGLPLTNPNAVLRLKMTAGGAFNVKMSTVVTGIGQMGIEPGR